MRTADCFKVIGIVLKMIQNVINIVIFIPWKSNMMDMSNLFDTKIRGKNVFSRSYPKTPFNLCNW